MNANHMNDKEKEILRKRLKERRNFLNLTYKQLSEKTGISKSTLQRYENGGIKNLPYDKIFILSQALEVTPEYFTNLSSDYTCSAINESSESYKFLKSANSRYEYLHKVNHFEETALKILTPHLVLNGYSVEQNARRPFSDLVAIKGKYVWHFDFLYIDDVDINRRYIHLKQRIISRFGRLAIYDKPITKYSLVLNNKSLCEELLKLKPIHLNMDVSIIILNQKDFEELYFQ